MADANVLPKNFPDDYSFQWKRVDGSTETNVGTDSHQYDVVVGDVGKTVKVEATFVDGGGRRGNAHERRVGRGDGALRRRLVRHPQGPKLRGTRLLGAIRQGARRIST